MSKVINIVAQFLPGTSLEEAIRIAQNLAHEYDCDCSFKFNGVPLKVNDKMNLRDVVKYYMQRIKVISSQSR